MALEVTLSVVVFLWYSVLLNEINTIAHAILVILSE